MSVFSKWQYHVSKEEVHTSLLAGAPWVRWCETPRNSSEPGRVIDRVRMPSEEDGEHLGALLECVPLDTVRFAFAYGSGAIAQYGSQTEDKMVDFIIASSNSHTFHEENLDRNPSHYSMIRRLGARSITNMQRNFAARVFYNTLIRYKVRPLWCFIFFTIALIA